MYRISKGNYDPISLDYPDFALKVLNATLQKDVEKRKMYIDDFLYGFGADMV